MADRIVSWGGFDSKSTSGMGVTGSLNLIGDLNFQAGATRYISMSASPTTASGNSIVIQAGDATASGTGGNIYLYPGAGAGGPAPGRTYIGNQNGWDGVYVTGLLTVGNSGPNTGTAFTVNAGGNLAMRYDWDNINFVTSAVSAGNRILRFTGASQYQVRGSGTTSSTTALLVQNANASASFSIKDNGDSTFFYPGVAGYSLKISGSYSGNGASAIYETLGATGGYYGIHEFRTGFNTTLSTRAMSIVYGGRVVIGNRSDTVLQNPAANLFVDTNVTNTFSSASFNTGIIINPSGSVNTQLTASGIQFNFGTGNNDINGGAFVGSQYNPAANGYDSDLVIYNSQATPGSYVETARFVGKSKSLSLGAGRNPSASLHISGSSNSALFKIDSPAVNNILFVSGSGNVGIGTGTPTSPLTVYNATRSELLLDTVNTNDEASRIIFRQNSPNWPSSIGTHVSAGGANYGLQIKSGGVLNMVTNTSGNNFFGSVFTIPTARVHILGSGTTSSTTALLVQNANASASLSVTDDGLVTFHRGTYMNAASSDFFHTVDTGDANYGGIVLKNNTQNYAGYITTGRSGNGNAINFLHTTFAGAFSASPIQQFNASSVTFGRINGTSPNILTVYGTPVSNITSNATINVVGSINTTNTGAKLAFQCGTVDTGAAIDSGGIVVFKTNIGGSDNINTRMVFYNRQNTTLIERLRIADTGNILIGTTADPGYKLNVSGSGNFTNNLTVTGSATISNILTLTPQDPLPTGVGTGSFAVSSSVPPKPYFYDGTSWNALY